MGRYEVVCFDVGGVLVDSPSGWVALNNYFNVSETALTHRQLFRTGNITYSQWAEVAVNVWKKEAGANKQAIIDGIKATMKPVTGARETFKELRKRGYKLAIVSSDVDLILDVFFDKKEFDYLFINHILFDEKGKITGAQATPYYAWKKIEALEKIAETEKTQLKNMVMVANEYYEADVLTPKIGLFIGFNCMNQETRDKSDVVVDKFDLREVLKYL